jgi:hypothetical protein
VLPRSDGDLENMFIVALGGVEVVYGQLGAAILNKSRTGTLEGISVQTAEPIINEAEVSPVARV